MLRNRLLLLQHATATPTTPINAMRLQLRPKSSSSSAGSTNATRQSRIMGKLFGNRVAGTKKRWFPSHDANSSAGGGSGGGYQPPSVVFQASQFGKSQSIGSKHNTRRMSVLNKLFMTHITDLLATGEAADAILGRGMQVSRVKISSDFACINVYWLGGNGNDAALEAELQRCSGQLRHELSQLRLMGEVPRIKFVRDKTGSNMNSVESILRHLNLQPIEHDEDQETEPSRTYDVAQTARQEFYGNAAAAVNVVPEMRHDVLGLDRGLIMDKILSKMRKSKQAWEQHQQQQQHTGITDTVADSSSTELLRIQQKLEDAQANQHKFDTFLARRRDRERKQTPERKKYRRDDELLAMASTTPAVDYDERDRYDQEDYILEDDKEKPDSYRNS